MALIQCRTYHGICSHTRASRARIRLRASIAVTAKRSIRFIWIGTHARHRTTNAHVVALIQCGTNNGHCTRASACDARIHLRAAIVVSAYRTVRLVRIRAHTRHRIARARNMALIQRCARHRVRPSARSCQTRIRLRTPIRVITRRTIRLVRIRAHARHRITRARNVALVQRGTRHRVCPRARTSRATIRLRASIAVIANGTSRLERI